jgi:hypothetical protein
MKLKSVPGLRFFCALVCVVLLSSLLTATFGQGRRRNAGGINEVATLYDSGTRPMVGSRVIYPLDERFATFKQVGRPLLVVQVALNQDVIGYVFPTKEDIAGTDFPRTATGEPLPIYVEGVKGGTTGQPGRWLWPPDQFVTGIPCVDCR